MKQKQITSPAKGTSPQLTPKMLANKLFVDYALPQFFEYYNYGKMRNVKDKLSKSYYTHNALTIIQQIAVFFGKDKANLYSLSDLSVLDLACGSSQCKDGFDKFTYQPHFARAFAEIGSRIVGADILNNDSERFEQVYLDLLNPNALGPAVFASDSFDVIRLHMLVDIKPIGSWLFAEDYKVKAVIGGQSLNVAPDSPALLRRIDQIASRDKTDNDVLRTGGFSLFVNSLLENVPRMLKENGLFLLENLRFVKRNGELEQIELPKI